MLTEQTPLCRVTILGMVFVCCWSSGCMRAHFPTYGQIPYAPPTGVPTELNKISLPAYVIEPPDVLLIEVYLPPDDPVKGPIALFPQPITGQHLVRIDGSVGLGIWGNVPVAGLTMNQAMEAIRKHIFDQIQTNRSLRPKDVPPIQKPEQLLVILDVLAYNSKSYYVITDGAGYGEQIYKFTATGNETVLDALANVGGLPTVGSKRHMWLARRTPNPGQPQQLLPIDYVGTTQHGITLTNYQILPGDRLYVKAERIFRVDSFLQKFLTPVERILGVTLLGSSTVNSISGRNLNNGFR